MIQEILKIINKNFVVVGNCSGENFVINTTSQIYFPDLYMLGIQIELKAKVFFFLLHQVFECFFSGDFYIIFLI